MVHQVSLRSSFSCKNHIHVTCLSMMQCQAVGYSIKRLLPLMPPGVDQCPCLLILLICSVPILQTVFRYITFIGSQFL